MATAIDPVCDMEVDTANPPGGSFEHDGTTYFFCSPACREEFAANPDNRLRLTIGLQKRDGRWVVTHEHHSFCSTD